MNVLADNDGPRGARCRARTRAAIIDAAERAFAEFGYRRTRMEEGAELLEEEVTSFRPGALDRLGLTPRETEVLCAATRMEGEATSLGSCSSVCTRFASVLRIWKPSSACAPPPRPSPGGSARARGHRADHAPCRDRRRCDVPVIRARDPRRGTLVAVRASIRSGTSVAVVRRALLLGSTEAGVGALMSVESGTGRCGK